MIRRLALSATNQFARLRLASRAGVKIAASAQVNYRAIAARTPSCLIIGESSIVHANIVSDRTGSVVIIGNRTFVGASTIVCAQRIEIGDDVLISWGCTIVDHDSHSIAWSRRQYDVVAFGHDKKDWTGVKVGPVRIGSRSWIGLNSLVLEGVEIGEGSIVAAGSVVTKNVPPFTICGGNPAKIIRELASNER